VFDGWVRVGLAAAVLAGVLAGAHAAARPRSAGAAGVRSRHGVGVRDSGRRPDRGTWSEPRRARRDAPLDSVLLTRVRHAAFEDTRHDVPARCRPRRRRARLHGRPRLDARRVVHDPRASRALLSTASISTPAARGAGLDPRRPPSAIRLAVQADPAADGFHSLAEPSTDPRAPATPEQRERFEAILREPKPNDKRETSK
jgi:hypothetical protein